jgi:hypothetical protein
MGNAAIDPTNTYFHLAAGRAEVIPVDEHFWPSVIGGERRLDGWLVGSFAPGPGASASDHSA